MPLFFFFFFEGSGTGHLGLASRNRRAASPPEARGARPQSATAGQLGATGWGTEIHTALQYFTGRRGAQALSYGLFVG